MVVVSSCREVSASAITSATPSDSCQQAKLGTLSRLPAQAARKAGMTSNQHGPYVRGDTRVTMAGTAGSHLATSGANPKACLSSDWSLQLDSMKLDSLVIAHQPRRGEYVPGPCTHRPSSHGSRGCLKCVTASDALR